jgi:hypothetical protein
MVPSDEADADLRVYANHAAVTVTPNDVSIRFGLYTIPVLTERPADPTIEVPIRHAATVIIPIGIARPLAALLETQASAWEENFGGARPTPDQSIEGAPG